MGRIISLSKYHLFNILYGNNIITNFFFFLKFLFFKKKEVLVYVGVHKGTSLLKIFRNYKKCYCFEAEPSLFKKLKEKFKDFPSVNLYNYAVTDYNGKTSFNISSNEGASSSIGNFDNKWPGIKNSSIKMIKKINIPCINLLSFLKNEKVFYIEDYISDIQGNDYTVLKTLETMIKAQKIGSISCEVTHNKYHNIYYDLPGNNESKFDELLKENYTCIGKSWSVLRDKILNSLFKTGGWEMDLKWKLKK